DTSSEDGSENGAATTKYDIKITEDSGLYLEKNDKANNDNKKSGKDKDKGSSSDAAADDIVSSPDNEDILSCEEQLGDDVEIVSVTGKDETVELEADDILAVRITGSNNSVQVSIKPSAGDDPIPSMK